MAGRMRTLLFRTSALVVAITLVGCGTAFERPVNPWGGYEKWLHALYADPTTEPQIFENLLAHAAAAEEAGVRLAPGLYAEIGTFYLRSGDGASAKTYYQREAETWPQSVALMSTLIEVLDSNTRVAQ